MIWTMEMRDLRVNQSRMKNYWHDAEQMHVMETEE